MFEDAVMRYSDLAWVRGELSDEGVGPGRLQNDVEVMQKFRPEAIAHVSNVVGRLNRENGWSHCVI